MKQLDIFDIIEEDKEVKQPAMIKSFGNQDKSSIFTPYKMCYYQIIDFHVRYKVLFPVLIDREDIKEGSYYYYYFNEGVYYKSILIGDTVNNNFPFEFMEEKSKEYEEAKLFGIKYEIEKVVE